jgi:glutathione S-transferase
MRLSYSTTSPFVRKVMITVHELGLLDRVELVRTNPRQDVAALRPVNPLGKIPALVTDDGAVLYDSNVICEYLDVEFGGGRLIPAVGRPRWEVLTLTALGDGIIEAGLAFRTELARDKAQQSADVIDWQRAKIDAALARLDEVIPGLDGAFTIGVIACACAVGYIDFRIPEHGFVERRANVRPWFAKLSTRSSIAETVPRLA